MSIFTRTCTVLAAGGLLAGCGTMVPLSKQASGGAGSMTVSSGSGTGTGSGSAGGSGSGGSGSGAGLSGAGSGSGGSGGLGTSSAATGSSSGLTGSGSGTGTGTGSAGGTSGAGGTGGSGTTSGSGGGSTGSSSGTVSSKAPIPVALFYVDGGNQVISSVFPDSSVSFGNGQAEGNAIINDVNSHGGINGRPLKAYWIPIQATNATDAAVGQACLGAVQDDHPFAILSVFNISGELASCAVQTHTLLVDVALGAGDDYVYNQGQGLVFTPTQISRNAEAALVLDVAHSTGRISPATKIGVLDESDDPMYGRVVTNTIDPTLKSFGISEDTETLSAANDTNGISSAVLKFKTLGVKSVIFSLGAGGIPEVLFMQAAQQQDYYPNYLMGDSTDPSFVSSAAPAAEVKGIWGAGTMPLADVAASQYPDTPAEAHCINVENASFNPGYKNRGTSLTSTLYCDQIYSFTAIARAIQGPLTAANWEAVYHSFGNRYGPVTTFATEFTNASDYGASEYRQLAYQGSCSCVTFTSAITPLP